MSGLLGYFFGSGKKDAGPMTEDQMNADPELAMREALDARGDLATKLDGTLELEDFMFFRSVVMCQATRHFKTKKEALQEKKL